MRAAGEVGTRRAGKGKPVATLRWAAVGGNRERNGRRDRRAPPPAVSKLISKDRRVGWAVRAPQGMVGPFRS